MMDSVADKSKIRGGVGNIIDFNENNYEKFIKFCELNGYNLKDFQEELDRSMLEGNNNYLILPRQNGRKYVMDAVKKFKGVD